MEMLQENIKQYCQEISSLEGQVSKLQESGVWDATHMREAQAQATSLQAEVDSQQAELECMHNNLAVIHEQLETEEGEGSS